MSVPPERPRDLDAEPEIDLGRLWRATIVRWWLLVAGLVAGAIIGLLVSLGGGKQWKASAEVYLGTPLSPTGSSQISSPPTQLGLATAFVTSEYAARYTALHSGLPTSAIRGKVTTKPILGLTGTKVGAPAPLMFISLTGTKAAKIEKAANVLANLLVTKFHPYASAKIAYLTRDAKRDLAQLAEVTGRLKYLQAEQARLATSGANFQLVANYNVLISSAADQRAALQSDLTSAQTEVAAALDIEQARVEAPAVSVNQGGPSRRSGVVIGAIIGLVVGLLAAVFWEPISAQVRSHQTS
jgi:Chain length determinant protein